MPRVLTPGARFTTPVSTHGLSSVGSDDLRANHHSPHGSAYAQQPSEQQQSYHHRRHPSYPTSGYPYPARKTSLMSEDRNEHLGPKSPSTSATSSSDSSSGSANAVLPSITGLALPRPAQSQPGNNDHHPGMFAMRRGSITDPHLHASSPSGNGRSHSGSPRSSSPLSGSRTLSTSVSESTMPTLQHTVTVATAGPGYGTRRHSIAATSTISERESMTKAAAAASMASMASRDVHHNTLSISPVSGTPPRSASDGVPSRKRTRSPSPSANHGGINGQTYTSSLANSSSTIKRYGYETGPGSHPYSSTNGAPAHYTSLPTRRNTLPSITPYSTGNGAINTATNPESHPHSAHSHQPHHPHHHPHYRTGPPTGTSSSPPSPPSMHSSSVRGHPDMSTLSSDSAAMPARNFTRRRSSLGTSFTSADSNGTRTESPYARSPELRITHKLAERRRRQEMKELFDDLREALPVEPHLKTSKWEILSKALETIQRLRANQRDMASEINSLRQQLSNQGTGLSSNSTVANKVASTT